MEVTSVGEFTPAPVAKFNFRNDSRAQLFTLGFVSLVTLLIVVMVLGASYLNQSNKQPEGATSIDDATWTISRVDPSGSDFDLTLTSSIGNVRRYNGVRSYGLSNDRKILITSNNTALNIVSLPEDTRTKIAAPFDYAGDVGQAISWTADDKYFAMAVYKGQDVNDTHVVVYTKAGEVFKDVKDTFTTRAVTGGTALYPVKFSSSHNSFIARAYKSEDKDYYKSQNLTVDQLPAYLRVYNLEGQVNKELPVRDASTTGTTVVYFWDETGGYVLYRVMANNTEVNYADETQFVKVGIN
jgi:hypothetical protein